MKEVSVIGAILLFVSSTFICQAQFDKNGVYKGENLQQIAFPIGGMKVDKSGRHT